MLRYTIRTPRPDSHRIEVELVVPDARREIELFLPVWTPGSYLERHFARTVSGVRAESGGRPATVERSTPSRWRIACDPEGTGDLVVRYDVYAAESTVRTTYLGDDHALLAGHSLFLVPPDLRRRPVEVSWEPPPRWECACALEQRREGGRVRFLAENWDRLCDAPILAGSLHRFAFEAAGRAHEVVVADEADRELGGLVGDVAAIVAETIGRFGDPPYETYLFLVLPPSAAGGGLEHADSSVLRPSCSFPRKEDERLDALTLFAHEHFHAWNGKRLVPAALLDPDLERPADTSELWVVEGITAYYEELACVRAGVMGVATFLDRAARAFDEHYRSSGPALQSLLEAGRTAWVGLYRRDADFSNRAVNYYTQGRLTALLADLRLRRETEGRSGLDDALRLLFSRFGCRTRGYRSADVYQAVRESGGPVTAEALRREVERPGHVEAFEILEQAGLRPERVADDTGLADRRFGLFFERRSRRIRLVARGSAAEESGLAPGDEVLALEGRTLDDRGLRRGLASLRAGGRARLTVVRSGRLLERTLAAPEAPPERFVLRGLPRAPWAQGWLGGRT